MPAAEPAGRATDAGPFAFADAAAWEAWLADHHDQPGGVWLEIAKKGSPRTSVTITEALDVALCFGWIDGHRKGGDADHYLQRYSPRRPTSAWSQVNVAKVGALEAAGRLRETGRAAICAAQADGRWEGAYEAQRTATTPVDLADALAADPQAQATYDALDRTRRYGLFLPILKARTAERRAEEVRLALASLTTDG